MSTDLVPFSAAFAVEGQVREKGRWFQSLEDLSKKFKVLDPFVFYIF